MGFIFKNPGLSHKWERRFMCDFLNNSGTTQKRAGKFGQTFRRGLLHKQTTQISTTDDEKWN